MTGRERRPPRGRRGLRACLVPLAAVLALLLASASLDATSAAFSAGTSNPGNAWSAGRLAPPTGLTAVQTCSAGSIVFQNATRAKGSASLSLPTPAGTAAGDLLLAQVTNRGGQAELTAPSGWNLIRRDTSSRAGDGVPQVTSALYWRRAVSPEPTSATFTLAAAVDMVGGMLGYRGVSTTSPVDASASAAGATPTTTTPTVTTTVANAVLVDFTAKRQEALPAPTGTTERFRYLSDGTGEATQGASAGDVAFTGPGTAPTRSTSPAGASVEWLAQTVALRPAASTPSAVLSWTPSTSSWATGYVLERSSAGAVLTRSLTPVTTSGFTEGTLANGTAYTYRLWAYQGTWTSAPVTAGLTTSC